MICGSSDPTTVPRKSILQKCQVRVSHKSVARYTNGQVSVSSKSVPQDHQVECRARCQVRVSNESAEPSPTNVPSKQVCQVREPSHSVLQKWQVRTPHKSVRYECPTIMSPNIIKQQRPTKVSRKGARPAKVQVTSKSLPQERCAILSSKSVLQKQAYPTNGSRKHAN